MISYRIADIEKYLLPPFNVTINKIVKYSTELVNVLKSISLKTSYDIEDEKSLKCITTLQKHVKNATKN